MTPGGFLVLLVIAALCGALGQAIAGYTAGGCLVSIVLGFIGAFLGGWLAERFDLPTFFSVSVQGQDFPVFWSIIGAALTVALLSLLAGRRT
ncbi:MAG: GlsB/YeaQ/YmgE family stress response membrane protein [Gemmatimonadetes bacterium]|nr:GlsB/YeaQ/YmgE family stress response membrane protein [Gemmatimonadota bacterium]